MLVRVLGCTSLKRLLEAACVRYCALPTADKLLKDAAKSATRKVARYGRGGASYRMLSTAAYANGLSYVSNFLVEEACFCFQYLREMRTDPHAELAHRRKLKKQSTSALVGYGAAYTFATRAPAASPRRRQRKSPLSDPSAAPQVRHGLRHRRQTRLGHRHRRRVRRPPRHPPLVVARGAARPERGGIAQQPSRAHFPH